MNLKELINKPIENMTEEELKELERLGRREYDRNRAKQKKEKMRESYRRSLVKKGIETLKAQEANETKPENPAPPKPKKEKVKTPKLEINNPNDQIFFEELAALEWRMKKLNQPKKRHTFKTSLATLEALDAFCNEHLVEKGFVLQVALEEFMAKYK